ncbi:hypothetical protein PS850_01127 [Pseudomonas fluorescens]|nr:hypothetical protein PS850_01127 [Pseudomonas fluorescens]
MGFTLSYTYKDKRVVTQLAVDHMSPYAAVYYALFHSGASTIKPQQSWPNTYEGILELASEIGLTDIRFNHTD